MVVRNERSELLGYRDQLLAEVARVARRLAELREAEELAELDRVRGMVREVGAKALREGLVALGVKSAKGGAR